MRLCLLPRPLRAIVILTLLSTSALTSAQIPPAAKTKETTAESFKPCQTRSPNTGSFFDLTPLLKKPPEPEPSSTPDDGSSRKVNAARYPNSGANRHIQGRSDPSHQHRSSGRRKSKGRKLSILEEKDTKDEGPPTSYHSRGYDYPANFTMNFCGSVVEEEPADDGYRPLVGGSKLSNMRWENVSAYYVRDNLTFSLGRANSNLTWRGRKLTVNYTGGSPCPKAGTENSDQSDPDNWSKRRKSSLISLLCERDPLAPKVSIAFVGTNDECTYFFEARSNAACPAVQVEKQQVGPSGVFAVIAVITFLVYLFGGIVYQRAVMHQRGWRQLPNYSLWYGIFTFLQDLVVICLSSCGRCFGLSPGTGAGRKARGYNQVHNGPGSLDQLDEDGLSPVSGRLNGSANGGRGRSPQRRSEADENRLLDELDDDLA